MRTVGVLKTLEEIAFPLGITRLLIRDTQFWIRCRGVKSVVRESQEPGMTFTLHELRELLFVSLPYYLMMEHKLSARHGCLRTRPLTYTIRDNGTLIHRDK